MGQRRKTDRLAAYYTFRAGDRSNRLWLRPKATGPGPPALGDRPEARSRALGDRPKATLGLEGYSGLNCVSAFAKCQGSVTVRVSSTVLLL